jgi:hypothetical protein
MESTFFMLWVCHCRWSSSRLTRTLVSALSLRMAHVMDRLCPVTEYMLREGRTIKSGLFTNLELDTRKQKGNRTHGHFANLTISLSAASL